MVVSPCTKTGLPGAIRLIIHVTMQSIYPTPQLLIFRAFSNPPFIPNFPDYLALKNMLVNEDWNVCRTFNRLSVAFNVYAFN